MSRGTVLKVLVTVGMLVCTTGLIKAGCSTAVTAPVTQKPKKYNISYTIVIKQNVPFSFYKSMTSRMIEWPDVFPLLFKRRRSEKTNRKLLFRNRICTGMQTTSTWRYKVKSDKCVPPRKKEWRNRQKHAHKIGGVDIFARQIIQKQRFQNISVTVSDLSQKNWQVS